MAAGSVGLDDEAAAVGGAGVQLAAVEPSPARACRRGRGRGRGAVRRAGPRSSRRASRSRPGSQSSVDRRRARRARACGRWSAPPGRSGRRRGRGRPAARAARRRRARVDGQPALRAARRAASSSARPGCGASSVPSSSSRSTPSRRRMLGERLPAAAPRRGAAARRASSGSRVERGLGGVGLDGDHAERVRDDVVQLARDPRPLLVDGQLGGPLALVLEVGGEVAEPFGAVALVPQLPTNEPSGRNMPYANRSPASKARRASAMRATRSPKSSARAFGMNRPMRSIDLMASPSRAATSSGS